MLKDKTTAARSAGIVIAVLVLGIILGWAADSAKPSKVKVTGWMTWLRGNSRGNWPTVIEYNGVRFDCIPRTNPVDLGTDNIFIADRLYLDADYHTDEARRLRLLGEKLYEMMETDELKKAGAHSRRQAAQYIKWAEDAEAKAAKKAAEEPDDGG